MIKIEANIDHMRDTLHSIDKTLSFQAQSLKEHMRRTRINEKALTTFRQVVEADLAPVKRHVAGMNYLLKAVGVGTLVVSAMFSALKAYDYLTSRTHHGAKSHVSAEKVAPASRK